MNKDLVAILEYLEREKGIKRDVVIAAIEESLQLAARKTLHDAANISVKVDAKTGDIEVYCEKEIVEEIEDSVAEISIAEAREIDPDCETGQFIDVEVTPKDFGRIAAQTARQVIAQKLRSAERDVIYGEYRHREGEIVSGAVKRFARGANLIVDLGKVEAIMPARHYPKTERYQIGDRVQALLLAVQDLDNGGAEVLLSRNDPLFVQQLFDQEVPEISDGTVVIERIVREPGYRTKIAVRSNDMRVDPVGTCVGVRGTRVKSIVRELNNEKVDIIPFVADSVELLQNALDPVEIRKISVNEEDKVISIVVDDDNYATSLGRRGMNARLNSQLIGYELEVQKMSEYTQLVAVQRRELAEWSNEVLDQPLSVPGISGLLVDNLVEAGFDTARKVLRTDVAEIAAVPGMTMELSDRILELVKEQYGRLRNETEESSTPAEEEEREDKEQEDEEQEMIEDDATPQEQKIEEEVEE